MKLQKYSDKRLVLKTENKNELSIYSGTLSNDCFIKESVRITAAFPDLTPDFFRVFSDLLMNEGDFSDEKLKDAVTHVIKTCEYPRPTIARFLSFDKRLQLFDYRQIVKMTDQNRKAFQDYLRIVIPGEEKAWYAYKQDVIDYKLKLWKKS